MGQQTFYCPLCKDWFDIECWEDHKKHFGVEISHPKEWNSSANSQQIAGDHYKNKTIQPWDFIAANNIGFFEGNVISYLCRWREKGGMTDLLKAKHYLEKLIELNIKDSPSNETNSGTK